MKSGDKFTFEGKEYWSSQESKKNGGGTHFFAQEVSCANIKMRHIAYADLITETAKKDKLNVRFVAFMVLTECKESGMPRNAKFMSFINEMIKSFATDNGFTHSVMNPFRIADHDEFTRFIIKQKKSLA